MVLLNTAASRGTAFRHISFFRALQVFSHSAYISAEGAEWANLTEKDDPPHVCGLRWLRFTKNP